jgi:hypothetical protein
MRCGGPGIKRSSGVSCQAARVSIVYSPRVRDIITASLAPSEVHLASGTRRERTVTHPH